MTGASLKLNQRVNKREITFGGCREEIRDEITIPHPREKPGSSRSSAQDVLSLIPFYPARLIKGSALIRTLTEGCGWAGAPQGCCWGVCRDTGESGELREEGGSK